MANHKKNKNSKIAKRSPVASSTRASSAMSNCSLASGSKIPVPATTLAVAKPEYIKAICLEASETEAAPSAIETTSFDFKVLEDAAFNFNVPTTTTSNTTPTLANPESTEIETAEAGIEVTKPFTFKLPEDAVFNFNVPSVVLPAQAPPLDMSIPLRPVTRPTLLAINGDIQAINNDTQAIATGVSSVSSSMVLLSGNFQSVTSSMVALANNSHTTLAIMGENAGIQKELLEEQKVLVRVQKELLDNQIVMKEAIAKMVVDLPGMVKEVVGAEMEGFKREVLGKMAEIVVVMQTKAMEETKSIEDTKPVEETKPIQEFNNEAVEVEEYDMFVQKMENPLMEIICPLSHSMRWNKAIWVSECVRANKVVAGTQLGELVKKQAAQDIKGILQAGRAGGRGGGWCAVM